MAVLAAHAGERAVRYPAWPLHGAASERVIAQHYRRHRHHDFLRFLKPIDTAVPGGLDLHLICENCATHKTPEVRKWLLSHPPLPRAFHPDQFVLAQPGPRWFAELTTRKLRRSAHRSVTELEADIRKWINAWNAYPEPFLWTKTADEILDTLVVYRRRISDSGR